MKKGRRERDSGLVDMERVSEEKRGAIGRKSL